jgi:hypothetical protein
MRKGTVRGLLVGALTIGAIAAGCGDDDDDGGIATSELSKPEWLVEANAACKRADKVMNQEGRLLFSEGEPSEQEMKDFAIEVVVPAFRQTVEDIRALGAPAGDEEQVEAILASAEEGTGRLEQDPLSVFEDDEPSETDRLAAAYGITACGGEADGD